MATGLDYGTTPRYHRARKISKEISERRELKELTERDRNKLRNWVERVVLGQEICFE